jgi:hypothetical protein
MPRAQIPAGEVGKIQAVRLADGRYRARARPRDDTGTLRPLCVTAATESAAIAEIRRLAAAASTGGLGGLSPSSTIADAVPLWLAQIHARATAGSLTFSTFESYETAARMILVPACGGVRFDQLTVGRCDRILHRILEEQTVWKARRARAAVPEGRLQPTNMVALVRRSTRMIGAVETWHHLWRDGSVDRRTPASGPPWLNGVLARSIG